MAAPARPGRFILALAGFLIMLAFVPGDEASAQSVLAPQNVAVELGGGASTDIGGQKLIVSWDQVTIGTPIGYRVEWRVVGAASWSGVDIDGASTVQYEIDGLTNGTEYEIRLFTRFTGGPISAPSLSVNATPKSAVDQLVDFIESEIVPHGEEIGMDGKKRSPWLKEAWDKAKRYGTIINIDTFAPGLVGIRCEEDHPVWAHPCYPYDMGIHPNYVRNKFTIIHEMHHIFMTGPDLDSPITAADAVGQIFLFESAGECTRSPMLELYADLAALVTIKELFDEDRGAGYWQRCRRELGRNGPNSAERTMARTVLLDREVPEWFEQRFQGGDSEWNYEDHESVWKLYAGSGEHDMPTIQGLNGLFGGYCDPRRVIDASSALSRYGLSQNAGGRFENYDRRKHEASLIRNPWSDGGCYPEAPQDLRADYDEENKALVVTFSPPLIPGMSDIVDYRVTVGRQSGSCRAPRQEIVTPDGELRAEFRDLEPGDYRVEVQAMNLLHGPHDAYATTQVLDVPGEVSCQDVILVDPTWPLVPNDLGQGDRFRLMFGTQPQYTFTSLGNSLDQLDAAIKKAAAAGHEDIRAHSAAFRVLASDSSTHAQDWTGTWWTAHEPGAPIYWLNGSRVANDNADLYDGHWNYFRRGWGENEPPELTDAGGKPHRVGRTIFLTGSDYRGLQRIEFGITSAANNLQHQTVGEALPDNWYHPLVRGYPHVGLGGAIVTGPIRPYRGSPLRIAALMDSVDISFALYGLSSVFEVADPIATVEVIGEDLGHLESASVKVTIDREMTGSESLTVPLLFDGEPIRPSGYARLVTLRPEGASPGVTFDGVEVIFTGPEAELCARGYSCPRTGQGSGTEIIIRVNATYTVPPTEDVTVNVSIPGCYHEGGDSYRIVSSGLGPVCGAVTGDGQFTLLAPPDQPPPVTPPPTPQPPTRTPTPTPTPPTTPTPTPTPTQPPPLEPEPEVVTFSDLGSAATVHRKSLHSLVSKVVFDGLGCGEDRLCPTEPIQRWELAVALVRVIDGDDPAAVSHSRHRDVDGEEWWAAHIERIAELGIPLGCFSDPENFCPFDPVSRGEMASVLVRAFGLSPASGSAGFVDTDAGERGDDIDALYAAGITAGCELEPLRFCPSKAMTRSQAATFLFRAIATRQNS